MKFINSYLEESKKIIEKLEINKINFLIKEISNLKKRNGRLFFIGVGGSAANCSHAVNDFRKLCGIESYAITDNVSELTARTNDDGFYSVFSSWLKTSKLNKNDAIFILSVGGGNIQKKISVNIVEAIKLAKIRNCKIFGITGKKVGYTQKNADVCLLIPIINEKNITPHSESFQSVLLHLIVSHPKIKSFQTKW